MLSLGRGGRLVQIPNFGQKYNLKTPLSEASVLLFPSFFCIDHVVLWPYSMG